MTMILTKQEIEEFIVPSKPIPPKPYSQKIMDILAKYNVKITPKDMSEFWVINIPHDVQDCRDTINNFRSQFVHKTIKVNVNVRTYYYNYISSFVDIISFIKELYFDELKLKRNNIGKAYRTNFSLGVVTESFDPTADRYLYSIKYPDKFYYFTESIAANHRQVSYPTVLDKKTLYENVLHKITEEDVARWLTKNLDKSNVRVIGVISLVVKKILLSSFIGCGNVQLPKHIINMKSITSLQNIENNLCFFACIALSEGCRKDRYMMRTLELYKEYYGIKENGKKLNNEILKTYPGIVVTFLDKKEKLHVFDEIDKYEEFNKSVAINIVSIEEVEDGKTSCLPLRVSKYNTDDNRKMVHLNLYLNHFSYINEGKIDNLIGFDCNRCGKRFYESRNLVEHRKVCSKEIEISYDSKSKIFYKERNFIAELYDDYNVALLDNVGVFFAYDYIITFDLEAINITLNEDSETKIKYLTEQRALSYSVISNVPGFTKAIFKWFLNPKDLVVSLFEDFDAIQKVAKNLSILKVKPLFDKLETLLASHPNDYKIKNDLDNLKKWCNQIPILGFNSSGYDINILLGDGFIHEIIKRAGTKQDKKQDTFIIKNGKKYKAICTEQFRFLDQMLYCAMGTSLSGFLKAYSSNTEDQKFIFPYAWLNDYNKLKVKIIDIPIDAFNSILRNTRISENDFDEFRKTCAENNLVTVLDLLEYYNNKDVEPFLKACLKYKELYYNFKIDVYKDAFTLSGIAAKMLNLFSFPPDIFYFKKPKLNKSAEAIVISKAKLEGYQRSDIDKFKRSVEIDINKLQNLFRSQNYRCLYCWVKLKTNNWSLDRMENDNIHSLENCVLSCIECNKARSNIPIKRFYKTKTLERIVKHKLLDTIVIINEENKDVFQSIKANIIGGPSIVFHRYAETNKSMIQRIHYDSENKKWYHDSFGKMVKKIIGYDANALYLYCIAQPMLCGELKYIPLKNTKTYMTQMQEIINDVMNDKLFGIIDCNIEVPENLYEYFAEFPPLFINVEYSSDRGGEYMKNVIEKVLHRKHFSERKLISTMRARGLFKTNLIKWYLSHGLKITSMRGYIPAIKSAIYKNFVDWVSNSRRKGDVEVIDKNGNKTKPYQVLGDNAKNIGNSAFGQTIMNKEKHKKVEFVNEDKFNKKRTSFWFCDAEEFSVNRLEGIDDPDMLMMYAEEGITDQDERVYEVQSLKKSIKQDMPIQIGFSIMQDAKLRMLEFYYDFLDKYIHRSNFQLIQMDTDSMYMSIAEKDFDDLVKQELKEEYYNIKHMFIPVSEACRCKKCVNNPNIKSETMYQKRTPGLFKIEKTGHAMIALSSKCYYLLDNEISINQDKDKIASKGAQQSRHLDTTNKVALDNNLTKTLSWANYYNCLFNNQIVNGENSGLRYDDKMMRLYTQNKTMLSPIYVKRVVDDNGIHTYPLIM